MDWETTGKITLRQLMRITNSQAGMIISAKKNKLGYTLIELFSIKISMNNLYLSYDDTLNDVFLNEADHFLKNKIYSGSMPLPNKNDSIPKNTEFIDFISIPIFFSSETTLLIYLINPKKDIEDVNSVAIKASLHLLKQHLSNNPIPNEQISGDLVKTSASS